MQLVLEVVDLLARLGGGLAGVGEGLLDLPVEVGLVLFPAGLLVQQGLGLLPQVGLEAVDRGQLRDQLGLGLVPKHPRLVGDRAGPSSLRLGLLQGPVLAGYLAADRRQLTAGPSKPDPQLVPLLLQLQRLPVPGRVPLLQAVVVRPQLLDRGLELGQLLAGLVQRVLLLVQVEGLALQVPAQLGRLPQRAVLRLLQVGEGVVLEAGHVGQGVGQPIDRPHQRADAAVEPLHLDALLVQVVPVVAEGLPQALVLLVVLPQVRLGAGDPGHEALAVAPPPGLRQVVLQRPRRSGPGVAIGGEALGGRAGPGDLLGLRQEPSHQVGEPSPVADLEGPAGAILQQVGGDHLAGRGDDRQPAAQVVHLPEREVDLPLGVGGHQVEGQAGAGVLRPEGVDGDQPLEQQPRVVVGEERARVGVARGVRSDAVLAPVEVDPPLSGLLQHLQQVHQATGQVGPGPEHAPGHEDRAVRLGEGWQLRGAGDGDHAAGVAGAVHPGQGQQGQVVVLLPLVAEDEVVAPLQRVEDPHRLALVGALLELLLQDAGGEHVQDHLEPAVGQPSGLLRCLHQHHVGVHVADDRVQLVGLGEGEGVAR